jgi:hypothetical protein
MISNNPITITDTSDQFLNTAFRLKIDTPKVAYTYMDIVEPEDQNTEMPTFAMKLFSKGIATEPRSVSGQIEHGTIAHLEKMFGVDAKLNLISQLVKEDLTVLQLKLYNLYADLGRKNIGKRTKWQTFAEKKLKVSMPIYTSNMTRGVFLISQYINKTSRRGPGNFIVLARNLASLIQDDSSFVFSPMSSNREFKTIELIGSLNGISVFVNHKLPINDFTVTVGKKTEDNQPGVLIAEHTKTVYDIANPDFSTKCVIGSEDAIVSLGFNPSTNYYSREIVIGKAPLWKRILQLVPMF